MPIPAKEMTFDIPSQVSSVNVSYHIRRRTEEILIQDLEKTGSVWESQVCNRHILNNIFFGAWFTLL